jgi:hypothetical protein
VVHQIRVFAAALLRALHQHQARASDPSRLEVRAEQHIREKSAATNAFHIKHRDIASNIHQ